MTSFKKVISSIVAACTICGALTCGAFASTNSASAATAVNSLNYDFSEVYQEYKAFITDPITRYASSKNFTTTITVFRGSNYPARVSSVPYATGGGTYSYSATVNGTGTYSANYINYSTSSTESRDVALCIGFDIRETPGARFKITGTFYPNGK